jgi:hypothetical protein
MVWSARSIAIRRLLKLRWPADIALRDIVAASEDAISDPSQIDLNIFCPNVDLHDLKTTNSRLNHHLQIVLSSQRRLNSEALASADMFLCGF